MSATSTFEKYRSILRRYTAAEHIFLYWKGRVGLYALLNALDIQDGDEVIVPGFTCVVVPNAILYLGATPIYVDIETETYSATLESIQAAVTPKTKVIICQNTFGYSHQVDEICAWAKAQGIYTIEDCTHGFGGHFNGKPNGSYADAAFFSTQWNKPFSTGLGGFVSTNDETLAQRLSTLNEDLVQPSFKELLSLSIQRQIRHWLPRRLYWAARRLYRWLSARNLSLGSSSREELMGVHMPPQYFKAMSVRQARWGLQALRDFDAVQESRKRAAALYSDFLNAAGKIAVPDAAIPNHSFLCYPVLVQDKPAFFAAAEAAQIPIGDWFCSPIHPISSQYSNWKLDPNTLPNSLAVSKSIVNLPTSQADINEMLTQVKPLIKFIK